MRASILLMLTVLFAGTAWSQGKVTGKVTDRASGEALPGVAVVVSGSGSGVFTGADGAYSISANAASDKLVFTFHCRKGNSPDQQLRCQNHAKWKGGGVS